MQTRFQRKNFSNRSISEDATIRRLEIIERTDVAKVYGRILDATRRRAARMFKVYRGRDILFGTLSAALSIITSYSEIYSPERVMSMKSILEDLAYPLTAQGISDALSETVEGKPVTSSEALFYLMAKVLFGGVKKKSLDRNDVLLLGIATRADPNGLKDIGILRKNKDYSLIEPVDGSKLESFLKNKGVKVSDPKLRNAVDALHLLEFYACTYPGSTFMDRIQEVDSELFDEARLADNVVRKCHGEVIE